MAATSKAKKAAQEEVPEEVLIISHRCQHCEDGNPLRRTVRTADGIVKYQLTFKPGVPMLLTGDEVRAVEKDISSGALATVTVSPQYLEALLARTEDDALACQLDVLAAAVRDLMAQVRLLGEEPVASIGPTGLVTRNH